ncbi:prenyltransferase/squalene oxidase repeat-containing protein [Crassaminicella profunda]|uniref:prenyltransferase/squalene oxidase repeat-containing protein n=1 Tax=Crassaminicella profunda TaxID=1286698 RepID=UPI001CA69F54|nr:prenyltransferase/squalene oxidase repeat-containing protein [Crassaminicella profunda]QZY55690.1 terpene cyclase/mutase family protein [Crassaminicella profunda]
MKKNQSKLIVLFLSIIMVFSIVCSSAYATESKISREDVKKAAEKTIKYYHDTYKDKQYAGILDWPALGLFGFGEDVSGPKWTVNGKNGAYWREQQVKEAKLEPGYYDNALRSGVNTDYQRTIIAVCAAGKDPRNFGGKNLVEIEKSTMLPSGHFADSVMDNDTGKPVGEDLVNAHIFGIIALHCAGEPIPNRDMCLYWLEDQQNLDGGFTFDVKYFDDPEDYDLVESDVDMTAAGIMALAILGEDESNPCVKKALDFLHSKQLDNGGFESWGTVNPESCAWAIQAIKLIGQDPMGSEWTTKSGENPVSAMLKFQIKDGSFVHVLNEEDNLPIYSNGMSTEQALYGMADAYNKKATYDLLFEKYRPTAEKHLFKDFKPGQFGFKKTADLIYNYIIAIDENGNFQPNEPIKKEEVSKWMKKAFDLKEVISIDKDTVTGEEFMGLLVKALGEEKEGKPSEILEIAKEKGWMYPEFDPQKIVNKAQCAWTLRQIRNISHQ